MRTLRTLGATVCCLVVSIQALSHDLGGIDLERRNALEDANELKEKIARNSLAVPLELPPELALDRKRRALKVLGDFRDQSSIAFTLASNFPGIQSVFQNDRAWDSGTKLQVCFLTPGNQAAKKVVAEVAVEWSRYANVRFDLGSAPTYETCRQGDGRVIRIELDASGNSSLIGTEAKGKDKTNRGTMFFSSHDVQFPGTARFRWLVLHEFGHALGLQHEHQHPSKNCIPQLKLESIERDFGWDETTAMENLSRIKVSSVSESSDFFATGATGPNATVTYSVAYDAESAMHYDLKLEYFKQSPPGDCYINAVRAAPSKADQEAVARAYPKVNGKQLNAQRNSLLTRAIIYTPSLSIEQRQALQALHRGS